MAYAKTLAASADWLLTIQNEDGGWGLTASQASSLVNTAEALYVLAKAGRSEHKAAIRGLTYLEAHLFPHLETRGARTRFVAFPLFVISACYPRFKKVFQRKLRAWLLKEMNEDGGWSAEQSESESDVYSTFLVILALRSSGEPRSNFGQTENWLLALGTVDGWPFQKGQPQSPTATAYALLALHDLGCTEHELLSHGLQVLRETTSLNDETATLAGTVWTHCKYSNILAALALFDDDIFSKPIARAVRRSNHLISSDGGWMETADSNENRTVRSQYWAVFAHEALKACFDPSKFVPRIDAERTTSVLKAPEFTHILPDSKIWTIILPTRLYRLGVYFFSAFGIALTLGIGHVIPSVSTNFQKVAGLLIIGTAFYLVTKRAILFPRLSKALLMIAAVIGFLNLVFGVTFWGIIEFAEASIDSVLK